MRLELIDPALGRRRYYELSLAPSLLGGVALERRWGRIGAAGGSRRIELHDDLAAARAAFRRWRRRKVGKGYRRVGR
ncbi:MAG: WGR domain-containing protein [Pseudomonadota bacterium]